MAQGVTPGFSGLNLNTEQGLAALDAAVKALADSTAHVPGPLQALYAGVTGISDPASAAAHQLAALLAHALGLAPDRVQCHSDMDIAFRAAHAPGEGFLLYAGTGSIATFIDHEGQWHRAGGRGYALGDEGGGYWIAREALAQVWRGEDDRPGQWVESAMARSLFSRLGGADWAHTRQFVYGRDRGEIGTLALAVAEAAEFGDAQAMALLRRAGLELGRLGAVLHRRFGAKPVVAAGRALLLHPVVVQGLRAALPPDCALTIRQLEPHHAAARRACHLWPAAGG